MLKNEKFDQCITFSYDQTLFFFYVHISILRIVCLIYNDAHILCVDVFMLTGLNKNDEIIICLILLKQLYKNINVNCT